MLDFPQKTACIIWFAGCNMRCPYCHNPQIVKSKGRGTVEDIQEFLLKRRGLLDGVVLSGGEATSYPDLIPFIRSLRDLGYAIKLDTNGTHPRVVSELIERHLLDYVALDYKSPQGKFKTVTGIRNFSPFEETLELLCAQKNLPYEVRTTVHTSLLDENDINEILIDLDRRHYTGTYYLQNYIADNDRQTLGHMKSQVRQINKDLLIAPVNFSIVLRNF